MIDSPSDNVLPEFPSVVVWWKPYSPKTRLAGPSILAFMDSGSRRAFSSGGIIDHSMRCSHNVREKLQRRQPKVKQKGWVSCLHSAVLGIGLTHTEVFSILRSI
jgi:hypothetical protein